jgi:hypothetical protein
VDLASDEFAVREKATKELKRLGKAAEPALREALGKGPSLEVRKRAEEILEAIKNAAPEPEALRGPRAVEVLERAGTAEARKVLEALAGGDPEAALTREAKGALQRLGTKSD